MIQAGPRVLAVTGGATGFIGRCLCDPFRGLGWEVRAEDLQRLGIAVRNASESLHEVLC